MGSRIFLAFLLAAGISCSHSQQLHTPLSESPAWARSVVWYQIFPERFRNGDTKNDPTVADLDGSWPHVKPEEWKVSPWTSDWYKLQPWEEKNGKGFYFNAQLRRYGGDLQGVIDKLPYLSDLGINALYFTPLFQSPSLHKYDATMYHHIDSHFGADPAGDAKIVASEDPSDPTTWKWTSADKLFLRLLNEAHQRHMRVIIDGVFNHVGQTFWAFQDVVRNQQRSKFKEWFTIEQWDDPATPGNEFKYQCWYNVPELPELRKTADGMAQGPADHIHAVLRRWMDPNGDGDPADGIDGWRLDAADKVPKGFWRQFRTWARAINPDAYITGEIFWEDWGKDKMFDPAPWLQGDMFDAVMNYRWAREVDHFFVDKAQKILPSEFDARLDALRRNYPAERNFVMMNLLDSHDTDRLLSHIINPDLPYDHRTGVSDNHDYDVRKPGKEARTTMKLMLLFEMTALGAPLIYYGDEVGMWGADDPDERKPMLWSDLQYDPEVSHPFGLQRPADANVPDTNLYSYCRSLVKIRLANPALMTGEMTKLLADDAHDTYAYLRSAPGERIVVIVNNSSSQEPVEIGVPETQSGAAWKSLIDGSTYHLVDGKLKIVLAAESGAILREEPAR